MHKDQTLNAIKKQVRKTLEDLGIEPSEARAETELIIGHVTGFSAAKQALEANLDLKSESIAAIEQIMARRVLREPLQYCLGHAWFMGLKFLVSPGVFIPRSDTETLVEVTLNLLDSHHFSACDDLQIMEIGIGSGAIAVTLLTRLKQARVTAYDVSPKSIEVAQENAKAHGVLDRLTLINDDWHNASNHLFNVVVSNPPYIPLSENSELAPEVLDHEPKLALFGTDSDGLGHYRSMAQRVKSYLTKPALLAVEVGDNQSESVAEILNSAGWLKTAIHNDLSGRPRVVSAQA